MSDKASLFSKLTKLFKSGPVVKRRVRNISTGQRASTAVEVFKKAHSDVYNATLSAYGAFDRMSRYSDFCLVGDTFIATNHPDEIKKIKDIVDDFNSGNLDYSVFSYDHKSGNIVCGEIENAWLTGVRKIWEITLDSGDIIRCTDNHPFLLRNGEYVRADQLTVDTALMPFRRGKTKNGYNFNISSNRGLVYEHVQVSEHVHNKTLERNKKNPPGVNNKNRKDQSGIWNANANKQKVLQTIYNSYKPGMSLSELATKLNAPTENHIIGRLEWDNFQSWEDFVDRYSNHKVVSIVETNKFEEVYDITVKDYHNFALVNKKNEGLVFVHNSEMEATAEICSALDIYAEETVSPDEHGNVLHIHSDNRKIQEILEELFYDVLNVEFNLVMWTRNLVKFGDFFLFNDISPEFGVINAYPIAISEIEREEGYDPNDPSAVRFRWVTQGNQILENWQISHFRLLGNDAFLPYGSSVLEGARRIWRQLILIEDAMLVYRVIRAPERRVFYIDVGNVPPDEVHNYIEQAQTSLKRNQIVDKQTGKIDLRYNPLSVEEDYFLPVRGGETGTKIDTLAGGQNTAAIEDVEYIQKKLFSALKIPKAYLGFDESIGCLTGDTKIPLLDGRVLTMEQLVSESENGKENFAYSCTIDGEPIPGKINKAWLTKSVDKLYKITLDNGEVIRCTENHPFMLTDGSYKRADDLSVDESLMSLTNSLNESFKVSDIELVVLESPTDVYDLEIDEWHNFTLEAGVVVHNSKATLSQEDIRFSRSIQRIQKTIISELNKLAQIHLFCHGYESEDLSNFELFLSNPSTVAQLQKLELIRSRFEIAGMAPEGSVARTWVQRNVLGLTSSEIEEIHKERIKEKKKDLEVEQIGAEGMDEGGMFGGGVGGGLGSIGGGDFGGGDFDLGGDDFPDLGGDLGGDEPQEEEEVDLADSDKKNDSLLDGLPVKPLSYIEKVKNNKKQNLIDDDDEIQKMSILDEESIFKVDKILEDDEEKNVFGQKIKNKKRKYRRDLITNPDHLKMVTHKRHQDTFKDPYGRQTAPNKLIDEAEQLTTTAPRLTTELVGTLEKMSKVFNIHNNYKNLLTESDDKDDNE